MNKQKLVLLLGLIEQKRKNYCPSGDNGTYDTSILMLDESIYVAIRNAVHHRDGVDMEFIKDRLRSYALYTVQLSNWGLNGITYTLLLDRLTVLLREIKVFGSKNRFTCVQCQHRMFINNKDIEKLCHGGGLMKTCSKCQRKHTLVNTESMVVLCDG